MLFEEMRLADAGRREAESVTGGGEETILAEEDRGPSNSEADISGWFEKAKFRFPVDDRKGASRAMFHLVQTRLTNERPEGYNAIARCPRQ